MINAAHLEQAENVLKRTYKIGIGEPRIIADRAQVNRLALDRFMQHHKAKLFREYMPDVDPRLEPAIMTMFLHMFAVGAISQRLSEGKES